MPGVTAAPLRGRGVCYCRDKTHSHLAHAAHMLYACTQVDIRYDRKRSLFVSTRFQHNAVSTRYQRGTNALPSRCRAVLAAAGHAFSCRKYWDWAVFSLQFFGKVPPGQPLPLDLWLPLSHGKGQLHVNVPLRLSALPLRLAPCICACVRDGVHRRSSSCS